MHDALTGLPNRRYVAEAWTKEVHRAARRNTAIGVMPAIGLVSASP